MIRFPLRYARANVLIGPGGEAAGLNSVVLEHLQRAGEQPHLVAALRARDAHVQITRSQPAHR